MEKVSFESGVEERSDA